MKLQPDILKRAKLFFTILHVTFLFIGYAQDSTITNNYGMRIYEPNISKFIGDTAKKCDYRIYYYANGRKHQEGCLVNTKKEGAWKEYNELGWLRFEFNYKNDVKNGGYKVFFENGNINATGTYLNGAIHDTLTIYDLDHKLVSKSLWKPVGYKKSKEVWRKIYIKNAKSDGTIEVINGKKYVWSRGEKLKLN